MHRLLAAAALAAAAACTSSAPSPTPPPRGCASDAECGSGEWCREGFCRSWEPDLSIDLPACPNGCPATQVCADGRCIGHVPPDAGPERP